jgi:hypothetical protein
MREPGNILTVNTFGTSPAFREASPHAVQPQPAAENARVPRSYGGTKAPAYDGRLS